MSTTAQNHVIEYKKKLLLLYLPKAYAELAISHFDENFASRLTLHDNQVLAFAFSWSDTPEGFQFWNSVSNYLSEMIDKRNSQRKKMYYQLPPLP